MPRGNPGEPTNFRLDPALKAEAITLAEAEGKKLNQIVQELLSAWVRKKSRAAPSKRPEAP